MATMPYVEHEAAREKGLFENLTDFSFERMVTPRMLKLLYGLHLLLGLIVAIGLPLTALGQPKPTVWWR